MRNPRAAPRARPAAAPVPAASAAARGGLPAASAAADAYAASREAPAAAGGAPEVVVTGAGGRTGKLVLAKLLDRGVRAVGVVRSEKKRAKLAQELAGRLEDAAAVDEALAVGDIADLEFLQEVTKGAKTLVLASSATPQIKKRSIALMMVKKLIPGMKPSMPSFRFPQDGEPQRVDFDFALNQFAAAKQNGVQQVVYCGSMGGTQADNRLNLIGDGNILVWKRRAEMALVQSGLKYTIVHPGGLIDKPGGERELRLAVDDALLEDTENRTVPRDDVAEMLVQCIGMPEAFNKSFDLSSFAPSEERAPTTDFAAAVEALGEATCDYSLNLPPGAEPPV